MHYQPIPSQKRFIISRLFTVYDFPILAHCLILQMVRFSCSFYSYWEAYCIFRVKCSIQIFVEMNVLKS